MLPSSSAWTLETLGPQPRPRCLRGQACPPTLQRPLPQIWRPPGVEGQYFPYPPFPPALALCQALGTAITEATPVLKEPGLTGEMETAGWPGLGALEGEPNPPRDPAGLSLNLLPQLVMVTRLSGRTRAHTRVHTGSGPCSPGHSDPVHASTLTMSIGRSA